jgi:hypothetical protein
MRRFFELFQILQAPPDELSKTPDKPPQKRQAPPAESKGPLPIDFRSHSHLGWTHYRILLGIKDNMECLSDQINLLKINEINVKRGVV